MKYIISTLGCKVNQYETQAMETILHERGHESAAPGELAAAGADVIVAEMPALRAWLFEE